MEKGPIDQTQAYPEPQPGDVPPPYFPQNEAGGQHMGFVGGPPIQGQPMPQVVQVVHVQNLGTRATRMNCPHCGADIETRVKHTPGCMTHVAALILCLVFWPCVCVPYCIDDCQDAEHDCPNCDRHIGTSKR